jgi:hypothetical protein
VSIIANQIMTNATLFTFSRRIVRTRADVLAQVAAPDLDYELQGLPRGIPAGVLGELRWETVHIALSC